MAIRGSAPVPLIPKPVKIDQPVTDGSSALAPEPAPLESTIEPLELVKIEPANILGIFTKEGALQPHLDALALKARSYVCDITTKRGRENVASLAYSIAKVKTALEKQGVELNKKLKELPTAVDKNKKAAWVFLENLQAEVRKPLTDWEAEQDRIAEAKRLADETAALARQIDADHEIALTLNWAFDKRRQEESAELDRMVAEREAEIAREAAEAERLAGIQREAEAAVALAKAEQDKADAIQREKDAEARAEQARKDAEAAKIQAEKDAAELAERNCLAAIKAKEDADARAEQAAILARQQEQQRQEAARKAEADAVALRERNAKHRQRIHSEAKEDLILAGLTPEIAVAVVNAVKDGKVRHITIGY